MWMLFAAAGCSSSHGFARVGPRSFTLEDVLLRTKQQSFENSGAKVTPQLAARQLLKAFATAEVLAKYGRPVTPEVLETEAARIDRATLMPARLQQTKDLFPTREQYLRLYVLPVYVGRVAYFEFFSMSPEFHRARREKIEGFARSFNGHSPFKEAALKSGLSYNRVQISRAAANALYETLARLSSGRLSPVIEGPSHFAVFRVVRREKDGTFLADAATIEKEPYEPWLQREFRDVKAECLEQTLCPEALRAYQGG